MRDIGVRMALGADAGRVMRLVLGEGLRLAALGAAIGLVASFVIARLAQGLLPDAPAWDARLVGRRRRHHARRVGRRRLSFPRAARARWIPSPC